MSTNIPTLSKHADELVAGAQYLAQSLKQIVDLPIETIEAGHASPLVTSMTIFILSCFVGYYVVWKVTPALHTPLMSVTNAISGVIIIGAMLASGSGIWEASSILGLIAAFLAAINIFGGFIVTTRMLAMFKKK